MTFQDHLRQVATQAVTSISASEAHDVYVVSFLVYDEDDDPRRPTLTIGYNTQTRVRQILAAQPGSELLPAGAPTDEAEARWNYAFWLQNELAVIGDSTHDPVGAQLRDQWINDSGLWFDDNRLHQRNSRVSVKAAIRPICVMIPCCRPAPAAALLTVNPPQRRSTSGPSLKWFDHRGSVVLSNSSEVLHVTQVADHRRWIPLAGRHAPAARARREPARRGNRSRR